MLSFILWQYVVFLTGSKSVQVFHHLIIYVYCSWRSSYQEGRFGFHQSVHRHHIFVRPVPSQDIDFQRHNYVIVPFFAVGEGKRWLLVLLILVELLTITVLSTTPSLYVHTLSVSLRPNTWLTDLSRDTLSDSPSTLTWFSESSLSSVLDKPATRIWRSTYLYSNLLVCIVNI